MGWAEGNYGDLIRDGDPRVEPVLRAIARRRGAAFVEGCMRAVHAHGLEPSVEWMLQTMEALDWGQEP